MMGTRIKKKIVVYSVEHEVAAEIENKVSFSGHKEYFQNWIEMCKLHTTKNSDYSHGDDPLANFKAANRLGERASRGIAIRMQDKIARFENWERNHSFEVKTESIVDTMLDLANYCLLYLAASADEKSENVESSFNEQTTNPNDLKTMDSCNPYHA